MPNIPPRPSPVHNRYIGLSVEIDRKGAMDGVSVTFMPIGYGDGGAVLNIIWNAEAGFDNSNTTKDDEDAEGRDLKWIEIETAGERETLGLALIELGDCLKAQLKSLEK